MELSRYLKSMSFPLRAAAGRPAGGYPFVTISRQCGAGGLSLAEALVAALESEEDPAFKGWHVFDREICERLAADPRLKVSLRDLLEERFHGEIEGGRELASLMVFWLKSPARAPAGMVRP